MKRYTTGYFHIACARHTASVFFLLLLTLGSAACVAPGADYNSPLPTYGGAYTPPQNVQPTDIHILSGDLAW